MSVRVLLAVALLTTLSACSGFAPTLSQDQQTQVSRIDLYHELPADRLQVPRKSSSSTRSSVSVGIGSGFKISGLFVGVLFDIPLNRERNDAPVTQVDRVRELLQGYSFQPVIEDALREAALYSDTPVLSDPRTIPVGSTPEDLLATSETGAVLTATSGYGMSPRGDAIEIQLQFALQLAAGGDAVRRKAVYQSPAANWSRELLVSELEKGAREVVELMLLDLRDHRSTEELAAYLTTLDTHLGKRSTSTTDAYAVGKSRDDSVGYYRLKSGDLYALAHNQPLQLHRSAN
ncbi:MAG: hypothetical protein AAF420_10275 [Pseudomonadota bacterium]